MTWRQQRVQEMADLINGFPFDSADFSDDGELPLVRIRDILGTSFETFVSTGVVPESAMIRDGDVVVGMDGDFNVVHWSRGSAALNQRLCLLRANGRADTRFLAYALPAHLQVINDLTYATTVKHLSSGQVRGIRMTAPDLPEQRAIADYLDRETARIDTLIDEQQRLIEMLRERRQAEIDAAFSMLGDPGVQLRRYIAFLTSGSRGWGGYYADEGERFLRIGNLPRANLNIRGEIQFVNLPEDVTEGSRTVLREGDLLFSITAYLGSVAVVEGEWVGAYVSQHVALCRLNLDRVDPRFIGWFMLTTTGRDQLNEGAVGGTKVQLALDDIRGLRVPTAPLHDQSRIAAHLDEQTARIDETISETERFIELSRERRSALITAAVTGQIDVREVA